MYGEYLSPLHIQTGDNKASVSVRVVAVWPYPNRHYRNGCRLTLPINANDPPTQANGYLMLKK